MTTSTQREENPQILDAATLLLALGYATTLIVAVGWAATL